MKRLVQLSIALALLACCPIATAQFETATVLGSVHDATGAVVPGATVSLRNNETGISATAVTDSVGNYQFLNVRIGFYTVRAEMQGFSVAVAENVKVTVNARQRVDLVLQVGNLSQSVTVSGAAALVETESSDRGTVVASEQIVNLPLNGRAYADLALLSPGVRKSGISTSRDASFNVHGLRSSLNNFTLDGVDNNSYGTSNQGFSNQVVQVSPDAVAEFKVQTNNFSAEFGRAGGAVVNASLRGGTNQFRGSVWEFLRNTSLNAVGFFKPTAGIKPVLIRNQFGFAYGGPIIRDRAFFFVDYEGFRQVQRSIRFASIPTLDQRAGILGKNVRNPLTGETYTGGVPDGAITPFAKKVLAALPAPTLAGIANNYDSLPRQSDYNDKFDAKIDYQVSSKISSFVRLSHRKMNNFEPPSIPGPSGGDSNGYVRVLNQQLAGGITYTLSPASLIEFRLGVSRTDAGKSGIGQGGPAMQELYGISGLPTDPRYAGGLTRQAITGWSAIGRQESNPQFQNPTAWNPRVNYSWLKGKFSWKFGYEYQAIATEIDDVHPKYGRDTYGNQFSRPSGISSDPATYNLADFMLGLRSNYTIINAFVFNLRQRMHFAYAQNDWKVSPNLTLNLGLRYEFATPQWEKDNHLTNFNPDTSKLIYAGDGSIYDRTLVHPDRNNFAPRLGMAYRLNSGTVVRAGYGVSYVHFNRLGGENLLSFNGPHVVEVNIDQLPTQGLCVGNADPTKCFRTTQMGYPTGYNVPANFDTLKARVNFIPSDTRTGYVQSWHLTVQHEIARNLLLDVGYIGNKSTKLVVLGDYNQSRANNVGESSSLQARRPLSAYQFIQIAFPGGMGNYHAFQTKLERRFTSGFYALNSFTWSKAIDNASGHLEAQNGDNSRVNFRDIRSDKGLSSYDQPFNNTTSFVWDLPFGRGRKFGSDVAPVVDALLGGWRLTGINTMTSGTPINLNYSPSSLQSVSSAPTYRPNVTGSLYPSEKTITNYFDKNNIVAPTDVSKPFGNAGRNSARSHGFYQADLGLHKDFKLFREQNKLEFRAEFFNIFNKTNFGPANSGRSSSAFGTISSTYPARQIQFGLKLHF
jgi:outer membrane receptor protein involved in Fe transport